MPLRAPFPVLLAAALCALPHAAGADVIGVVAPQAGPFELLGKQILDGAAFAAEQAGHQIWLISETCEDGSGPATAKRLADQKVVAAIGFLCSETLDGALPVLKEAGIPAITLSVRWQGLMEDALKRDWPFLRMAPSGGAEAAKLTDAIIERWPGAALALVDDGTINARELSETIRATLEERGMKPVFTDTFRPGQDQQIALVRRLQRAGVTHAFVGGDRNDVAIIARDAAAEDIPLTLVGGESLNAANEPVALADGVHAVRRPDYAAWPQNAEIVAALRARGIEPEGYVLPGHAAVELVSQAARQARDTGGTLSQTLLSGEFQTATGPVAFTQGHELRDNPFALMVWRDGSFVSAEPPGQ